MSTHKKVLTVLVILGLTVGLAGVANAVILQGWTDTETSLFITDANGNHAGSGWSGNTLTLNYGPSVEPFSPADNNSHTGNPNNFIPNGAVGLHFGVSQNTDVGEIYVNFRGFDDDPGCVFEHNARTTNNNMDFIAGVYFFRYGIHYHYDIPELVNNNITYVDFIFFDDAITTPETYFDFRGQSMGSAGTTTFSDVSWIISEGDINTLPSPFNATGAVPEPATMLLLPLGLAGFRLLRRRKR